MTPSPWGWIDEHESDHVSGVVTGEVVGEHAAPREADQHIRRAGANLLQTRRSGRQRAAASGPWRPIRSALTPRGHMRRPAPSTRPGQDPTPDLERIARASLKDDDRCSWTAVLKSDGLDAHSTTIELDHPHSREYRVLLGVASD